MTKHTIVKFQLHRTGIVLIVIGCIVISLLLVAAGYVTGYAKGSGAFAALKGASGAGLKPAGLKPGLHPAATAPVAAAAPASRPGFSPAPPAAPPPEAFSLRVGKTWNEEAAKAWQTELKGKEITAVIVAMPAENGVTIYSVEIGRYPDRHAAADEAERLKDRQGIETVVVPAAPLPKPP
jgi:cell division septation protein DedD